MKQHLHQGGTTFLGSLVMMYSGQKVAGPNLKPLQPQGSILHFTCTKCSFLMSSPHRTPGPPRCSPCSWPQQSCLPKASPTSPHILLLLRPQLAVLQAFCPHSLPSHDPMLSLHFQTTFPSSVKDLFKDTGANFAAPSYSVALPCSWLNAPPRSPLPTLIPTCTSASPQRRSPVLGHSLCGVLLWES